MNNNNKEYPFKYIEKYVQNYWYKNNTFRTNNNTKIKKFYCLCMFPYPSGKLHIGHVRNYTIGDIISRFNRMLGKNVLFPIGWDCFGLPAENASIINNINPKIWTYNNIKYMKKQMIMLGYSFDWNKELFTCKKKYYKYEQNFIKILFNKKIMYRKKSYINWCINDKTVLANEQVINNKCWRCNNTIKKKKKIQWFLKVSKFSDILLNNINSLTWNNNIKIMQKNWIGKNEWYEMILPIYYNKKIIKKIKILLYEENYINILNIKNIIVSKNNFILKNILLNKKILFKNKIYTYNPINKSIINIKILNNISDKIKINNDLKLINNYINNNNIYKKKINIFNYFFFINKKYINKIINNKIKNYIKIFLYKKKIIFYKKIFNIKDWCISRQRKWGTPIPIIYNKINKKIKYFINKDFKVKKNIVFEKDTFDTFIESSLYHIIFTYSKNYKNMMNNKITNYWLPIDSYIGGVEHATMHLIYIRYFNILLKKFNIIKCDEPIKELICQGMVNSKSYYYINNNNKIWISPEDINKNKYKKFNIIYNGISKMSKSKNNGINPINIIKKYGSDSLRIFIIFLSPIESDILWEEKKILGVYRFLKKIWKLHIIIKKFNIKYKKKRINKNENILYKFLNNEISIITDLMNKKKYNIVISKLMNINNKINRILIINNINYFFIKYIYIKLIKLLYPFAPHISFFILKSLNIKNIDFCKWPKKTNIFYTKL